MRKQVLATLAGAALLAVPVIAFAAAGPPRVSTSPVDSSVDTDTYALLSGVVNPNGTNTNYWFEWGTTTAYGQTTDVTNASNGTADVPVDVSLDGLQPETTYHYRIAAQPVGSTDPSTIVYGADLSFETSHPLTAIFTGAKAPVKSNRAHIKISCIGPEGDTCQGRVNLSGTVKGHSAGFGSGGYTVDVNASKTISVYLSPAARHAIKAARTHHVFANAATKPTGSKVKSANKLILVG